MAWIIGIAVGLIAGVLLAGWLYNRYIENFGGD